MLKEPGIYVMKINDGPNNMDKVAIFHGKSEKSIGIVYSIEWIYSYFYDLRTGMMLDPKRVGADREEIFEMVPADPKIVINQLFRISK